MIEDAIQKAVNDLCTIREDRENIPALAVELASLRERANCVLKLVDDDSGEWECSNCKDAWVFIDGGPEENNYKYCASCGAKIIELARPPEVKS